MIAHDGRIREGDSVPREGFISLAESRIVLKTNLQILSKSDSFPKKSSHFEIRWARDKHNDEMNED